MYVIIGKFLRCLAPTHKSNLVRYMSASQCKLSENHVEEIEIPVPWGRIAGKWWGDKLIPPVLAIHGWQDNANSFDKLIPLLNVSSVLAIDLPGHGLSSHFPEGRAYDFGEHVVMLHRIKKYFNWEKMPLLTHSLGAAFGYAYASMFPDDVKWVVNFECSRTVLPLLRSDIHNGMSRGIDAFLKTENIKKEGCPPSYKLSDMIKMTIEGSLGSVASPEAALTLLKRGMNVTEMPSLKTDDKILSDLGDFVSYEKQAIMLLPEEERENSLKVFLELTESISRAKKKLETFPLPEGDNKYYTFQRDPSIKVVIFQSFDEEFIIEASKNIKCPVLSIRAKQGFLFGSTRKFYEQTLHILKENCKYLEHHDVDGTHHAHLNNPEKLAPIINNFIHKCETLKQ